MPPPQAEDRELKRKSLALLEWAMADMSPDMSLTIKCGIEREGHFVPEVLAPPTQDVQKWKADQHAATQANAAKMQERLSNDPDLAKVYHDTVGAFMIEGVTKPLSPVKAPEAMERISRRMLIQGDAMGMDGNFGPVPVKEAIDKLNAAGSKLGTPDYASQAFVDFKNEVFDVGGQPTLVGRGQHCNVSVWAGGRNLFQRTAGSDGPELMHNATEEALAWLPSMFLPYRNGNYHRKEDSSHMPYVLSAGDLDTKKSQHVIRYTSDRTLRSWKPEAFRLEFRQGAAEADPYDVALAAITPIVHTCDTEIKKTDGKAQFSDKGIPVLLHTRPFPAKYRKPTLTEDEAKAQFNQPDNPYFLYLNELAERKIARARDANAHDASAVNRLALKEAKELSGIGSRLHASYCIQYGMESTMPQPQRVRIAGA